MEPSVDPLSPTTTSPRSAASFSAFCAFSMHMPSEFASFRHGITTDTSTGSTVTFVTSCVVNCGWSADPRLVSNDSPQHNKFAINESGGTLPRGFRFLFRDAPVLWRFSESCRVPSLSTTSDTSSSTVAVVPSRGRLLRVLGVWFGIAAAIGNTIAAGIVRSPGDIAQWLPKPFLFLSAWVVGGLYALVGASSMAELAAAIPLSGGQYNFSRRGLGEFAGFLVGWSDWLSTCGTAAAVAIVIAEYSAAFLPVLNGKAVLLRYGFTYQQIAAVLIIFAFFI